MPRITDYSFLFKPMSGIKKQILLAVLSYHK